MITTFTLLFMLLLSFNTVAQESKPYNFHIIGDVQGYEDGTKVYLSKENRISDSATIRKDHFEFTGQIEEPVNVYLFFNSLGADFTTAWLDEGKVFIEGTRMNIRNAKITGNLLNEEDNILSQRIEPVELKMDSMDELLNYDLPKDSLIQVEKVYEKLEEEEALIHQNFIKEFPDSYLSVHLLSIYSIEWGKEKTAELYSYLTLKNRKSREGKKIAEFIQNNKGLKIGDHYVDFELTNPDGEKKRLSDYMGKVTLLEFWASWCAPCRKENPNLAKTYKNYYQKGFSVFGVSLDIDEKSWKAAIQKDGLHWEHVADLKRHTNLAAQIYGVYMIPDNFLINEEGIIIGKNLRGEELNEKLKEILK